MFDANRVYGRFAAPRSPCAQGILVPGGAPTRPVGCRSPAICELLLAPAPPQSGPGDELCGRSVPVCGDNAAVNLARAGWLTTVAACLVAVVILLLQGYVGYAGVTFAVGISAAINLR